MVVKLTPCLIGMEAGSGAHHWAREFENHGHTVRLMAPKFVAPYRTSGKRCQNETEPGHKQSRRTAWCHRVSNPV